MSWLDQYKTGLFNCVSDNSGRIVPFREVLLTSFGVPHKWFYNSGSWVHGEGNDLNTMYNLRKMDVNDPGYDAAKQQAKLTMQCITPSAVCDFKKKGMERVTSFNPIMQLDFDRLYQYDLDEVRQAIFAYDFVCFCGKSVSGHGLYALCLIEHAERLADYAEHMFYFFEKRGIPIDTGKGSNPMQLRFLSYDASMMIRDYPRPLKVKRFNTRKVVTKPATAYTNADGLVHWAINQIQVAQEGQRFDTVRVVAYTLGGHGTGLDDLKTAINNTQAFNGVERKYLKVAEDCFNAGKQKPL